MPPGALAVVAAGIALCFAARALSVGPDWGPPYIDAIGPRNGADSVATGALAYAVFTKPMDRVSAERAFVLRRARDGSVVGGRYEWYGPVGMVFVPDGRLRPNTRYVAWVAGRARDTGGESMPGRLRWEFRTGPE
ncbi:MAG: Ig-like domain-containing protein [Solirubrobacterales bacterium]